jgi:CHAT domain-containing protein/Tfp pilus assembly protein PilF
MPPAPLKRVALPFSSVALLLLLLHAAAAYAPRRAEDARASPTPSASEKGEPCADARASVAEADRLRGEWKRDSLREAADRYAAAAACMRAAGARGEAEAALMRAGDTDFLLSEYARARGEYAEALKGLKAAGDRRGEAEALNKLGLVYSYLGDTDNAARRSQESLELSRKIGDKAVEARALDSLSFAYYMRSDLARALEGFKQALTAARETGDRLEEAQVLLNLGYTLNDEGELEEALSYYKQALPLWREVNHPRGLSRALTAIGGIYSALGESQSALDHHRQALELARQMGDADSQSAIQNGIGCVYETLGDYDKALDAYAEALEGFRAAGNLPGEAQTSQFVGHAYSLLGDDAKAQELYEQGLALSRKLGDPTLEALALNRIGGVEQESGRRKEAMASFERALSLYSLTGNRRAEAITLNNIGDLLRAQGDGRAALARHARALPMARESGDRALELLTLTSMARIERDLGELDAARTRLESSLKIIESLRTKIVNLDLRASYLAAVRQHYELYIDVLMRTSRARPSEGLAADALKVSELARARSLLDMLVEGHADVRRGADPALLEKEQSLRHSLERLDDRQMRLLGARHTPEQAAALDEEVRSVTAEYEQVESQIREKSPLYAALTQPQPLDLEAIQRNVLDDRTLLLEYALGDERSYLWVVSRSGMTAYELPPRAQIEGAALRVYSLLLACQPVEGETGAQRQARAAEAESQYWARAAELGEMTLGPAAEQLGDKRLLVVADGALQYIPFGALTLPRAAPSNRETASSSGAEATTDDNAPLVLEHEVVTLPSASLLWVLRRDAARRAPAPKTVAVLADPVFEKDDPRVNADGVAQPARASALLSDEQRDRSIRGGIREGLEKGITRLMGSREEADAIMSFAPAGGGLEVVGFEASRARAMSEELGQYQIVHFATHGILDSQHPESSGIVLSLVDEAGRPQNGFLRLRDVYNLNLPAELVVLSACDTGLGKDVRGEGLIGLTRGFMYAGASSVMASLWRVDDDATTELMKHFYQGVLKDGLRPAAALREAQLRMWRQKRWRSPYFWAGFVLQGDYDRTIRGGVVGARRVWLTAGVAGLLLLFICAASFYALKWRRAARGRASSDAEGALLDG